ncbi:MAG TPA: hypothetical protein P5191_11460 [Ruminococcus sp.]|nr:hypothetical protein [Ruminococcus sp.]
MLSPLERRKNNFGRSLLPSFGAEMRKYEEVYQLYTSEGYTRELCELYADTFVRDVKKPAPEDIIQLVKLYDRIHENKTADFYLQMLEERKLSGDDRYNYCIEMLKTQSKLGRWREAEDFRTANINFLQNYSQKKPLQQQADMYIALALADCSAKHYKEAFKLMKFGYKPQGKNDTKLLEIMITGVYLLTKCGDEEGTEAAVESAKACLKLFSEFEFGWSKQYYESCIEDAAEGIL